MNMMQCAGKAIVSAVTLTLSFHAWSQGASAYPTRPVRIIVPTPAGGPSDTAARQIAQALAASLGQQFVVENRAGASGAIAAQAVKSAAADGYTLLWALSSLAGLPALQKNAPFKHMNEFAPVSNVLNFSYGMFASKDVPANSFKELVEFGKSHPDKLTYATGTLSEYMIGAYVLKSSGVKAIRVPYKGGAQAMPDLISGQVQVNFGPILSGLQHVRAGKIKMLATLTPQRSALTPQVPTLAELGVPQSSFPTWNAIFAPAGTPKEVIEKLSGAISQATKSPVIRTAFEQQGAEPIGSTPQKLAEAVESAHAAWGDFVRDYDIPQE